MSSPYPLQPPDTSTDTISESDPQVQRYLRSFQKALRRRPTDLQRSLMVNAAVLQVRFERASRDLNFGAQNLAHLERCARKAGNAMQASFPTRGSPTPALGNALLAVRS
jgi:hypothetical protein